MTTLSGRPFIYTIKGIDKCPVLGEISPKLFKEALTYEPDATDVFVVSYPKTGTTWAQNLVMHLLKFEERGTEGTKVDQMGTYLEYVLGKEAAEKLPKPRFLKTHLPFELQPYNPKTKYVYVTRNPFDTCVSFYKHTQGFFQYQFDGTFDEYFECFIRGEVDNGNYFEHVLSWNAHKDDDNVCFITYEELKETPNETIVKMGKFLGGKSAELIKDPKNVEEIIKHCSFDSMKKKDQVKASGLGKKDFDFIRKGIIGDYKNFFNENQIERLKENYNSYLKGTHLHEYWNKVLGF